MLVEEFTMIDGCFRCDNKDSLVSVKNHESFNHDTGEPELYNGYLCIICGCFHTEDGTMKEYTSFRGETSYNVASWLNKN